MKNYKNILKVLSVFLIILYSCEDATEIVQTSELGEDNAFRNINDVQSGLNQAYTSYNPAAGGNAATQEEVMFNAVFTDNIKYGAESSGHGSQLYQFILDPTTLAATNIWDRRYDVVNIANRTLAAIDRLDFKNNELVKANHIKAQLFGLRALAHFDLYKYYTTDYKDMNALSAIIVDFVPEPLDAFERNTVGELLTFIKNDLTKAESLFVSSDAVANNKFYVTKDFYKFLRAKIALFEGQYSTASILANEVLTDNPISDANGFQNVWNDTSQTGLVFVLSKLNGDSEINDLFSANGQGVSGSPIFEISNELYNLFDIGDVRKGVYVHPDTNIVGLNSPDNLILIGKFPGSADHPRINDVKVFRSAEMLLIKAETQARSGDFVGAANTIQNLRANRYTSGLPSTPIFNNLNDALITILEESRKEFCFEGHRFIDIKRLRSDLNIGINKLNVDCDSFNATECSLSTNSHKFTFPIPQAELNANNNISQNTGY